MASAIASAFPTGTRYPYSLLHNLGWTPQTISADHRASASQTRHLFPKNLKLLKRDIAPVHQRLGGHYLDSTDSIFLQLAADKFRTYMWQHFAERFLFSGCDLDFHLRKAGFKGSAIIPHPIAVMVARRVQPPAPCALRKA